MSVVESWLTEHGDTVEVYRVSKSCLREGCAVDHREYRWRVRAAGNHEVVGSGEAHPDRSDAEAAALRHHPRVEVEE